MGTIPYHTYHMGVSSHYAYLPYHTLLTIWESIMHTYHTIPYLPYGSQLTLCILTIPYHIYHMGIHYAYLPYHTILTIWESAHILHTYQTIPYLPWIEIHSKSASPKHERELTHI